MNKAINIKNSTKEVVRVLSITDESAVDDSPNDLVYFKITNYVAPPTLTNPLDINYPMYNKVTGEFYWKTVNYQYTATEGLIEVENLKQVVATLQAEKNNLQETVDTLLFESLGGGNNV